MFLIENTTKLVKHELIAFINRALEIKKTGKGSINIMISKEPHMLYFFILN